MPRGNLGTRWQIIKVRTEWGGSKSVPSKCLIAGSQRTGNYANKNAQAAPNQCRPDGRWSHLGSSTNVCCPLESAAQAANQCSLGPALDGGAGRQCQTDSSVSLSNFLPSAGITRLCVSQTIMRARPNQISRGWSFVCWSWCNCVWGAAPLASACSQCSPSALECPSWRCFCQPHQQLQSTQQTIGIHSFYVDSMLGQRRKRWPNIESP